LAATDTTPAGAGENAGAEPASLVSAIIPTFNRRDEVIDCIESLLKSTYPRLEILVVDNASEDGTAEALAARFGDRIRLIRSPVNLFAGGGRNRGAEDAKGDYLLFVDSDNVVDPRMVEVLVQSMASIQDIRIGICGPMMYFHSKPDRLCGYDWDISLLTSRTWWKGIGDPDTGQFRDRPYLPVGHMPNLFMLRRETFREAGGIDPDYVMHYEESDLAEKVKRAGGAVVLIPGAKTWHKLPWTKPRGDRQFSGANKALLYYAVRNRILFMRKNSGGLRLFLFLTVFAQLFLAYNLAMLLRNGRPGLAGLVLKAHLAGFTFRLRRQAQAPQPPSPPTCSRPRT
jgi:GT2 family glycosyltransferase